MQRIEYHGENTLTLRAMRSHVLQLLKEHMPVAAVETPVPQMAAEDAEIDRLRTENKSLLDELDTARAK